MLVEIGSRDERTSGVANWVLGSDAGRTARPHDGAMESTSRPVCLLLTALGTAASRAEFVGRVEVVTTGEVIAVRSLDELGQLLKRLTGATVD